MLIIPTQSDPPVVFEKWERKKKTQKLLRTCPGFPTAVASILIKSGYVSEESGSATRFQKLK
jgi:hypothetical protein